jgi:ArsR family transcriptional regulator
MTAPSAADLLVTIAEPTRLRILNCLAAAPLFVSDLQAILCLPQPTVSRHLTVLRHSEVVRDTPVGQYVLYRLRGDGPGGHLLRAILAGLDGDAPMKVERHQALARSRDRTRQVLGRASALIHN